MKGKEEEEEEEERSETWKKAEASRSLVSRKRRERLAGLKRNGRLLHRIQRRFDPHAETTESSSKRKRRMQNKTLALPGLTPRRLASGRG